MNAHARHVLICNSAVADLAAIAAEPEPGPPPSTVGSYSDRWRKYRADRAAWEVGREWLAERYAPLALARWLGRRPTCSETVLFSRAYESGEILGLWERVRENGKTVGLLLTDKGEALGRRGREAAHA